MSYIMYFRSILQAGLGDKHTLCFVRYVEVDTGWAESIVNLSIWRALNNMTKKSINLIMFVSVK